MVRLSLKKKKKCGYVSVKVYAHGCNTYSGQKRASGTLELEVTGSCESPDMGAGNQTRVLCKRRQELGCGGACL